MRPVKIWTLRPKFISIQWLIAYFVDLLNWHWNHPKWWAHFHWDRASYKFMYDFGSNNYRMLICDLYSVSVFSTSYFTTFGTCCAGERYFTIFIHFWMEVHHLSYIIIGSSLFEINTDILLCSYYSISSNASCKTFTAVLGH